MTFDAQKFYVARPEQLIGKITRKQAVWKKTTGPISWFNGATVPIGTEYKAFQTKNFGWVVLREAVAGRKIFQL